MTTTQIAPAARPTITADPWGPASPAKIAATAARLDAMDAMLADRDLSNFFGVDDDDADWEALGW